jgi:hypothetical protein
MSHKVTPHVSLAILFASLLLSVIIAVISFYSYISCSCHCSKSTTADVTEDSSKYIIVAGPNGDAVKVSSKLSGLTAYIADNKNEANVDNDFWKSKFKSWRDKMSQNDIAPSLTNFMDVVALSKIVKEN